MTTTAERPSPVEVRRARSHEARVRGFREDQLPCVPWRPKSHAMVEEAMRAVVDADPSRQRAPKSDLINNVANFCDLLERWARAEGSGQGRSNWFEIARDLYGRDVIRSREDVERRTTSLWRWAQWGRRAGLFEIEEAFDGNGGSDGVIWRHLDPALDSEVARRRSSAGEATQLPPCRLRRRSETRREREARRSRPRSRRTGRQSVPRLVREGRPRPGPLSFSSALSGNPSRPPCPTGTGGQESGAPAREAAGELVRRGRMFAAARRLAARQRRWSKRQAGGEGGLDPLRQAVHQDAPGVVVVLAAWMVWFDPEPRLKRERWAQLERSLAQVERVRGSRTEGPLWLLGVMEDSARRLGRAEQTGGALGLKRPESLGYFVVAFRQVARGMRRRWKHQQGHRRG